MRISTMRFVPVTRPISGSSIGPRSWPAAVGRESLQRDASFRIVASVMVTLDAQTESELNRLSASEGIPAGELAARLLRRAVRAKRPRPALDWAAIRAHAAAFAEEDLALADSDIAHRAELLEADDIAV